MQYNLCLASINNKMKSKIKWKYIKQCEEEPTFDWTGSYKGVSVDILSNYKGTWNILVNNKRVRQGVKTRDQAKAWIESNITLNAMSVQD